MESWQGGGGAKIRDFRAGEIRMGQPKVRGGHPPEPFQSRGNAPRLIRALHCGHNIGERYGDIEIHEGFPGRDTRQGGHQAYREIVQQSQEEKRRVREYDRTGDGLPDRWGFHPQEDDLTHPGANRSPG